LRHLLSNQSSVTNARNLRDGP